MNMQRKGIRLLEKLLYLKHMPRLIFEICNELVHQIGVQFASQLGN